MYIKRWCLCTAVGPDGDAEQVLTVVQFEGGSVEGDFECVEVDILPDLLMEPTEFFFLALFPRLRERIDPRRMVAIVNILDREASPTVDNTYFVVLVLLASQFIFVKLANAAECSNSQIKLCTIS